ncbi:MAG: RagB/SusD family protein, partial [Bacteroidota bacterium]
LTELNKVRTKTTDPAGIGAGLTPKTAGDLPNQQATLDEIFKQRQYELFISGLLLGDSRRFGKPQSDRTRNWLPFPDNERLSNPNTPADPAF